MKLLNRNVTKISPQAAVPAVLVCVLFIGGIEWQKLDELDHPEPNKVNCIGCHSDQKTLKSMADKAGDPLYLVHSGQMTEAELHSLLNVPDPAVTKKFLGSGSY